MIFCLHVAPSSVRDCGTPPTIDNATPTTPTGTTFGATAVYACNENYELEDPSVDTLTCGTTGTWDGPRPTCGKCITSFLGFPPAFFVLQVWERVRTRPVIQKGGGTRLVNVYNLMLDAHLTLNLTKLV